MKTLAPGCKRIAVFLDGTWNVTTDNTNVWRLSALCAPFSKSGVRQVKRYDIGVNGFWGGAFGKGVGTNIVAAYEWLVGEYDPGDEIFIFGFSRGAFTARSLAGFITKYGLLKPGAPLGVKQLFERYQRADDVTIRGLAAASTDGSLADPELEERWMLRYSQPVNIKMVGVWDTVGALGIPWFSFEGISRKTFGWMHTGLRIPIENAYHALAIDEHRRSFEPTLWTVKSTTRATPRSLDSVEQRWFVGNHGNIGGGYGGDVLVQAPLRWLQKKAEGHGLEFRYDAEIDPEHHAAPIPDSHADFMRGLYRLGSARYLRPIGLEQFSDERGTHSIINETIDGTVFERWHLNPAYRPGNLSDWARRKGVDPEDINGSVLAMAPKRPLGVD
ncbi:DUF2235 domain-containing protein [Aliihoeflea aestuarii]|jgi:uncharacterized protein (DUF2235 family)|uniref:phospholipase effector Tle1 domain-containing protein n=1 Tax=Aliihoeflea aestuarii TaxID=453840 RepID=UPI0020946412|nr:DUF2235 domain-containing protein [Aliihoeflea aestuarii]MCO6393266.1 DUF2235 domain-containing protein [Aliihoeflea aestuarii]